MTETALTSLGRYRVVSELGRGAMGIVYKAEDPQLERTVAIKTIRMSSESAEAAEYVARFRQEAKALGGLNHPAIITVFDAGRENDIAYMAMELLEGRELRDLLLESRPPLKLALDLAAQVAEGLAFAHERGVVHRDVKPSNIMVTAANRVKIMDFGIARVRKSDVKTQTGMLLGSPRYMSPEQILGRPVDHRSDLFSLGVVLYEMAAGTVPFSGADMNQLMFQVVNADPVPPTRVTPSAPELLDFIVAKALEKDPENRYQSGAEMAADLRLCAASMPDSQQPEAGDIGGDTWPLGADAPRLPSRPDAEARRTLEMVSRQAPAGDSESEKTLRLDVTRNGESRKASVAATQALVRRDDAALGLRLSRQFDARPALARLTRPNAADRVMLAPTAAAPGVVGRFRRDPDLQGIVALLGLATVLAFLFAFA